MTLLLLNQYFDTLKDIATKGDCRVVFTPPTGGEGQGDDGTSASRMGFLQGSMGMPVGF